MGNGQRSESEMTTHTQPTEQLNLFGSRNNTQNFFVFAFVGP